MRRVGERPRQREVTPSYRAILTRPSQVPWKRRREVSSTTHESAREVGETAGESAMQASEVLVIQKTSRQHAVTPSSGAERAAVDWKWRGESGSLWARRGVLRRAAVVVAAARGGRVGCCDCRRTRTTSRGVTAGRDC